MLFHFIAEENRQQNIKHHHKRQGQKPKNGETNHSDEQENPPDLVAFPFRGFHLEGEKPQVAHHHEAENERDAEANPITQSAVSEVLDLGEGQWQRGDEDGHAWRGNTLE